MKPVLIRSAQDWQRVGKEGKMSTPREDVNAPDLYIPGKLPLSASAGVRQGPISSLSPSPSPLFSFSPLLLPFFSPLLISVFIFILLLFLCSFLSFFSSLSCPFAVMAFLTYVLVMGMALGTGQK